MSKLTAADVATLIPRYPTDVIHDMDGSLYGVDFSFRDHIDPDEVWDFVMDLPILRDITGVGEPGKALIDVLTSRNRDMYQRKGIYHCDTYEREDSWRVQLHINLRMYPEAITLLTDRSDSKADYSASFSEGDCVTLTFDLKKINKPNK